jgi:hypothetical protein
VGAVVREAILLGLIVAAGFVSSGVIASFYMLVTRQREYAPKAETEAGRLAAVGLTIFTGPSILALNAFRPQGAEDQPGGYRIFVAMLVMLWSYVLGLLVVNVAIRLPSPF